MKNICILVRNHPFGVLEAFGRMVADGLRRNGAEVVLVDVTSKDAAVRLRALSEAERIDLVLAINPSPMTARLNDRSLFSLIDARFGILLLDNPIYLMREITPLLPEMPDGSVFLTVDALHCRQLRVHLGRQHPGRFSTVFMPYGGPPSMPLSRPQSIEKPFDLAVFATLDQQISAEFRRSDDYRGAFPRIAHPLPADRIADIERRAVAMVEMGYSLDPVDAVAEVLGSDDVMSNPAHLAVAQVFDSYLKRYRRLAVLRALMADARTRAMKFAIFGTGWDRLGELPANWKIFGPSPYERQFEVFRHSRFVLNTDPNWTRGVHDRVFNAMAALCVPVTNRNLYTDVHLDDGRNCVLYERAGDVPERIAANLGRWADLAQAGLTEFRLNFTWQDRCRPLLNWLDLNP